MNGDLQQENLQQTFMLEEETGERNMLERHCREMRKDCLVMAKAAGGEGFHFGASLSIIEIVAVLYLRVMHIGKHLFRSEERDRFILSKGHGVPAIYAVLERMNVLSQEDLLTFKKEGSALSGHPCRNESLGIDFSSGSLGQGLSYGVGVALALKRKGNENARVFVLLGDGECDEGSVWEAAMAAAKYRLNHLVVIVDRNGMQYDGETEQVMPIESLEEKWKAFGWDAWGVDGHDTEQLKRAFRKESDRPRAIIAHTVKGKGISFMEHEGQWHHGMMTAAQEEQAWKEVVGDED